MSVCCPCLAFWCYGLFVHVLCVYLLNVLLVYWSVCSCTVCLLVERTVGVLVCLFMYCMFTCWTYCWCIGVFVHVLCVYLLNVLLVYWCVCSCTVCLLVERTVGVLVCLLNVCTVCLLVERTVGVLVCLFMYCMFTCWTYCWCIGVFLYRWRLWV